MIRPLQFIVDLHRTIRAARPEGAQESFPASPKKYERFPQFPLLAPRELNAKLTDTLEKRRSNASAMSGQIISFENISTILGASMRVRRDGHRSHPSGGGKYPLDVYVFAFNIESLPRSIFHYRPDTHTLEELWEIPRDAEPRTYFRDIGDFCEKASALLVFTGSWERSVQTYGTFAFELSLIEAGHIGQNIVLLANALGMSSRPFGGYKDAILVEAIDLDATRELPVYLIALGN